MQFKSREEWLAWRHTGIGGSDAPSLYNASNYRTRYQLWEQKSNPFVPEAEEADNFVQRIGNELESIARAKFAALYNAMYSADETFEPGAFRLANFPWMLCSVDGVSKSGSLITEIKNQSRPLAKGEKPHTPGQIAHANVENESLPFRGGRVREDYWIQCQHNLAVSGAEGCFFISFDGETLRYCLVPRDHEFITMHFDECGKFWTQVISKDPPAFSDRDYAPIVGKGLTEKSKKFLKLKARIEKDTAKLEEIKAELIEAAGDSKRARIGSLKIIEAKGRSGGIDYPRLMNHPSIMQAMSIHKLNVNDFKKPDGKPSRRILVGDVE